MKDDDDLVEGRVRRGRMLLAGAAGLALLVGLPFAFGILSGDPPVPDEAAPTPTPLFDGGAEDLHGRLVYTTFETEGPLGQRLVVLDLAAGSVSVGPLVPVAEELQAAGARGNQLLLIADDAGAQGVAFALSELSPSGRLLEVASGDVLSLSTDRTALLVGRSHPVAGNDVGCESHSVTLNRVELATGRERSLFEDRVSCGNLISATLDRDLLVASFVRDGRAEVDAIWPQNPTVLFRDLAHVSVSPRGTLLFVAPEGDLNALGVWPGTPSGPVFVWPGSGSPRPLVSDVELFAQRIVAWSDDGSQVVVNGSVRGERGMWLVYVPAGRIEPLLRPGVLSRRPASSGAAFDDEGSLFASVPGTIVVATDAGVFPLPLPPDAPSPAGPLAWLP